MPAQKIKTQGFLSEFLRRHEHLPDRPFCWVLGSGASLQSNIPTGGTLAHRWLSEIHEMEDFEDASLENWATPKNLGIEGFDFSRTPAFYPWIYQRRFRDFKEVGYAFLEAVMDEAEPSYGYSVLAQIMAGTPHKVAVTTNFDNLIADALSIYTRAFPLVCGHESLTGYIRANLRRPLVAKVHRDLLLNPRSEPGDIAELPEEWKNALRCIFDAYTPIVIGYGGNDGSLMGFLEQLAPIKGGIFWCFRQGDTPGEKIRKVVEHHQGRLVPIAGFDELMLQLRDKLKLESPIPELQRTHSKRVEGYQEQVKALTAKVMQPAKNKEAEQVRIPVREAAEAAVDQLAKEKRWWAWELKAGAESDLAKREAIYRDGLEDCAESAELMGSFANFLWKERRNSDEAERLYRRALELDPTHAINYGSFANFVWKVRNNSDEAESLYRRSLDLNPNDAATTGNFATFLWKDRRNAEEAERLYRRALELDPDNAEHTGNFANFLWKERNNYDETERLFRRAMELDAKTVDYDSAEKHFRKALKLEPTNARRLNGYAWFLATVREDFDKAEPLIRKALESDPNEGVFYDTLAYILYKGREDFSGAEVLFQKALELAPHNQQVKENFETFQQARPTRRRDGRTRSTGATDRQEAAPRPNETSAPTSGKKAG